MRGEIHGHPRLVGDTEDAWLNRLGFWVGDFPPTSETPLEDDDPNEREVRWTEWTR
jgi:hypothetical protein